MTAAYDYKQAMFHLTALCRLSFLTGQPPQEMPEAFARLTGAVSSALITPIRQTDLLEISAQICRGAMLGCWFGGSGGEAALRSLDLLEAELTALFSPSAAPSRLPDQLPLLEEAPPAERDAVSALYAAHLSVYKARLYLGDFGTPELDDHSHHRRSAR